MFPVPLPLPGYFGKSLTDFQSCVPAQACPGVDSGAVQKAVTQQLEQLKFASNQSTLIAVFDAFMSLTSFQLANDSSNYTAESESQSVSELEPVNLNVSFRDSTRGLLLFASVNLDGW
jgi:hypothetical protein